MDNANYDENVFDGQGYRYNVGIVLLNTQKQVFVGKRKGQEAWQFPQGGMHGGESGKDAMLRELFEETGLKAHQVNILQETEKWLHYRLPVRFRRRKFPGKIQCIGQKQKWFLLQLKDDDVCFDLNGDGAPEFDEWQWVNYWQPIEFVVHFKRDVYAQALEELSVAVPELRAQKPAGFHQRGRQKNVKHHLNPQKAPSFARRRRHN